jgi:hypothetical protein
VTATRRPVHAADPRGNRIASGERRAARAIDAANRGVAGSRPPFRHPQNTPKRGEVGGRRKVSKIKDLQNSRSKAMGSGYPSKRASCDRRRSAPIGQEGPWDRKLGEGNLSSWVIFARQKQPHAIRSCFYRVDVRGVTQPTSNSCTLGYKSADSSNLSAWVQRILNCCGVLKSLTSTLIQLPRGFPGCASGSRWVTRSGLAIDFPAMAAGH